MSDEKSGSNANTKKVKVSDGTRKVDQWIDRIVQRELPVLGYTVKSLSEIVGSSKASATHLSDTILRDPGMTSTILRVANSAYYNSGGPEITTVSRAVVLLGFQAVRNLSLSVSVMDRMVKGEVKTRQLELMAKSVFAATQSKSLAFKRKDNTPEEIFISTLLYHLGEMTFWCFASDEAKLLDQALKDPSKPRAVAEKEILGFRFSQLTRELSDEWRLGKTIKDALVYNDGRSGPPEARNIVLGHQIENAARRGWDSPVIKAVYQRCGTLCKAPVEEIEELVIETADKAGETAKLLNIDLNWRLKPPADTGKVSEEQAQIRERKPMAKLQDRILSEIEKMMPTNPDLQLLLRMVIEGIYRSSGMDRTLFAILTPDRNAFETRYILGDNDDSLAQSFKFPLKNSSYRLFNYILQQHQKPIWLSSQLTGPVQSMITPEIRQITGPGDFYIAPLVLAGRDIGILYAYRKNSGIKMDKESFTSFIKFAIQANNCLKRLSSQSSSKITRL